MRTGTSHWIRCVAAVSALCGIALYSALIPGHVVSQSTARLSGSIQAAGATSAARPLCHRDTTEAQDSTAPNAPSTPKKKCPFCSGYAAFVTAIVGDYDAGAIDAELITPSLVIFDDGFVEGESKRPHNRGPPRLPA